MGPTGSVGAAAADALITVAERQGWKERIADLFRRKHRVLVLGATGTGKTNLIDALHEDLPEAIDRLARTFSTAKRRIKVSGSLFQFIDTPGDIAAGHLRSAAIREALRTGISGIINVCAYGYHEYEYDGSEESRAITSTGAARRSWLSEHRQIEIDMVAEWIDMFADARTASWLLTIVNKADLWWGQRPAVREHYIDGAYAKELACAASSPLKKGVGVGA